MMTSLAIALSLTAIVLSGIAIIGSFMAYAKVTGFMHSTHKIEYRPLDLSAKVYNNQDLTDEIDEDGSIVPPRTNEGKDLLKTVKQQIYDQAPYDRDDDLF